MSIGKISMVAFDAFGTLVYIAKSLGPYRTLLTETGVKLTPEIRMLSMTEPLSFKAYARRIAPSCTDELLTRLQAQLDEEVASVTLFPESLETICSLRDKGIKMAVISNLAQPYGAPLKKLLAGLVDVWCLSYEVGAVKPDAAIFSKACDLAGCLPDSVLMVGDRQDNDVIGARKFGMKAVLIDQAAADAEFPDVVTKLKQMVPLVD